MSFSVSFPDWTSLEQVSGEGSFWDSRDISDMNETLIRTTLNLKEVSRKINAYERKRVKAQTEYNHKFRKLMADSSAKTESLKKRLAEMELEDLEFQLAVYEECVKELNRISSGIKQDLDTLKTVSYNLRTESRI